jgi:hypothetical protein
MISRFQNIVYEDLNPFEKTSEEVFLGLILKEAIESTSLSVNLT